jgi:UDP-N-acetylglucosamine diphosphorylase / glucose-1-phosphate thymidylyltransferase / UDP-N-acetylgalactosamine diphosphorylase / glucosamine-1-phosphate N-acetyltransferase / galactosamine-1-phosphate N-acetyltransferase
MDTAIILAAGSGTRMWPYAELRPKAMLPVANRPVIDYAIETLHELGVSRIVVVAGPHAAQLINYAANRPHVEVVRADGSGGTAFSLAAGWEACSSKPVLVLHGDSFVAREDLAALKTTFETDGVAAALVAPLGDEDPRAWVCCHVEDGMVRRIVGHPRGGHDRRFAAFALPPSLLPYMERNSGLFTNVQVGMMPLEEAYLEMSLADYMADGGTLRAVEATGPFIDLDKPWHLLMANAGAAELLCGRLTENVPADAAAIDDSAEIHGHVRLGPGSRIGRNVVIRGNAVVGANTVIDNGAVLGGTNVVGDNCRIRDYCSVGRGSVVGNSCVVQSGAELSGTIMDGVYLYHYMEFSGIAGQGSDLGAATVCGTLRFDDGESTHRVKGRREVPPAFANATYLGDYTRTGVNAVIMPGCKTGVYSVVGPGVVLTEDLPNRTMVTVKQELQYREWGPERYGW